MDELLENLASHSNCFISDLKSRDNYGRLVKALLAIDEKQYSSITWQDAFHYIVESAPNSNDVSAIKQELIESLQAK